MPFRSNLATPRSLNQHAFLVEIPRLSLVIRIVIVKPIEIGVNGP
jgi:hypothetical protein